MAVFNKIANQPGMQFRRALLKTSKQLTPDDLEQMKFLITGLPEKPGFAEIEEVKTTMAFFMVLVKYSLISEDNYEFLEYLLDEIGHKALMIQFTSLMAAGGTDENAALPSRETSTSASHDIPQSSSGSLLEYAPDVSSTSSCSGSGISIPDAHAVNPNGLSRTSNPQILPATSTQINPNHVSVRPKMAKPVDTTTELQTSLTSSTATKQMSPFGSSPDGSVFFNDPPETSKTSKLQEQAKSDKNRTSFNSSNVITKQSVDSVQTLISAQMAQVHQSRTTSHAQSPPEGIHGKNQNQICIHPAFASKQLMPSGKVQSFQEQAHKQQIVSKIECDQSLKAIDNKPEKIKKQAESYNTTPKFSHSSSWPEVKESHNITGQQNWISSAVNSFGIKPLTSAEVPGFTTPHIVDLNCLMSTPNSSDLGPTIQSPSVSLQDADFAQAQTERNSQVPDFGHQSGEGHNDLGLVEQVGRSGLQYYQESLIATKGSLPSSDLETDAPDEGNTAFYVGDKCQFENSTTNKSRWERNPSLNIPCSLSPPPPTSVNHSIDVKRFQASTWPKSEETIPILKGNQLFGPVGDGAVLSMQQNASSQDVVTLQKHKPPTALKDGALCTSEESTSTFVSTAPVQSTFEHREQKESRARDGDKFEGLKRKVQDSLAKQRASKEQAQLQEPSEDIDDQSKEQIKLRKYQEELAAPAKSGDNFIICAPTGSGKTLTAASICRHFYDRAKANDGHFKALFIVNMRHLTEQQTAAFRGVFPDGTVATIGETEMLSKVFYVSNHAVVMVTAQILLNTLLKKTPDINLRDISMIIFDECHHTTQAHPYNEIMKVYLKDKKVKLNTDAVIGKSGRYLPQILGLSASLGVGHGRDAYRHILTLCGNMDVANVIQVVKNQDELKKHVNSPERDQILYVQPRQPEDRELWPIIENIMCEIENELWPRGVPEIHGTDSYGQWAVLTRQGAEQTSERVHVLACLYLYEFNRALMLYDELRGIDAFQHLEASMAKRDVKQNPVPMEELCREYFKENRERMQNICSAETDSHNPKLDQLGKLLKKKFMENPKSKGIVLVRTRLATEAIVDFIKETQHLKNLPERVKPIRLVGQGQDTETERYMTENEQKQALQKFREDNNCNVLVATDIAQEGLDMPACNFVIRYNFVSNEIGTVQSKGRARAKQSECFLIVERNSKLAEREQQNHQNVIDMQAAMDRLNGLPEERRVFEITERQNEIYNEIRRNDEKTRLKKGIHDPEDVKLFCKECNAYITKASFLRKKDCHYTCVDPKIKDRVKIIRQDRQEFRTTINTGVFKCANTDCGQQLGTAIDFMDADGKVITHKGFGFKVTSFLFKLPDGSPMTYKKWKLVTFDIPEYRECEEEQQFVPVLLT